jgi:hypothetical protein
MKINLSSFQEYIAEEDLVRFHFMNEMQGRDCLCIAEEITLDISLWNFLETIQGLIKKIGSHCHLNHMHGFRHSSYCFEVDDEHCNPSMLVQVNWHSDADIHTPEKAVFQVCITGDPSSAQTLLKFIRESFPERLARVRWWFMAGDNLQFHDVVLHKPSALKAEYYPFMPKEPMDYMKDYLDHNAALLFLSGPAGTGKTTLLRNFLYSNKLRAVVTYEDTLFNSDQMFVDFVTSSNHDVMIIEDADLMLSSREHAGNKMIARFLNASDGIIQLHKKKIIFTTNLSNFNDVDEALVRPGRAYGSIIFRQLTPTEAGIAAQAADITDWTTPDRDVSLAEIFNPPNTSSFGKRMVGF